MKGGNMNCPKCGRAGAYIRLKTKEVVCRICGHIEEIKSIELKPEPKQ